jgi:hypothetical protein
MSYLGRVSSGRVGLSFHPFHLPGRQKWFAARGDEFDHACTQ